MGSPLHNVAFAPSGTFAPEESVPWDRFLRGDCPSYERSFSASASCSAMSLALTEIFSSESASS